MSKLNVKKLIRIIINLVVKVLIPALIVSFIFFNGNIRMIFIISILAVIINIIGISIGIRRERLIIFYKALKGNELINAEYDEKSYSERMIALKAMQETCEILIKEINILKSNKNKQKKKKPIGMELTIRIMEIKLEILFYLFVLINILGIIMITITIILYLINKTNDTITILGFVGGFTESLGVILFKNYKMLQIKIVEIKNNKHQQDQYTNKLKKAILIKDNKKRYKMLEKAADDYLNEK